MGRISTIPIGLTQGLNYCSFCDVADVYHLWRYMHKLAESYAAVPVVVLHF